MTDIELLMRVHELATQCKPPNRLKITFVYTNNGEIFYKLDLAPGGGEYYEYASILELIEKLEELVSSQNKYEVGQEVWMVYDNEPRCFSVHQYQYQADRYIYVLNGHPLCWLDESLIFATKEELIDKQVKHWNSLRYHPTIKESVASAEKSKSILGETIAKQAERFHKTEMELLQKLIKDNAINERKIIDESSYRSD